MKSYLSGLSHALIARGLLAISFGLLALFIPGLTLYIFILIFGCFSLFDGIISVLFSFTKIKDDPNWWFLLIQGFLSMIVGLLVLRTQFLNEVTLVTYIAIWLFATGILEIITALRISKVMKEERWYILSGALSVLAGVIVLINPIEGVKALTWIIGINAILLGSIFILMGTRLSNRVKKMELTRMDKK